MFLRIEYSIDFRIFIFIVVSEVHPTSDNEPTLKTRQPKSKKQAEVDLDFSNSLEKNLSLAKNILDLFAPPKNPKSLLLPESRLPCNTKLPEDCHYQPENLVKLFLLPNVKVVCLRQRNQFENISLVGNIYLYF